MLNVLSVEGDLGLPDKMLYLNFVNQLFLWSRWHLFADLDAFKLWFQLFHLIVFVLTALWCIVKLLSLVKLLHFQLLLLFLFNFLSEFGFDDGQSQVVKEECTNNHDGVVVADHPSADTLHQTYHHASPTLKRDCLEYLHDREQHVVEVSRSIIRVFSALRTNELWCTRLLTAAAGIW